jgi:hypothetical protein
MLRDALTPAQRATAYKLLAVVSFVQLVVLGVPGVPGVVSSVIAAVISAAQLAGFSMAKANTNVAPPASDA